MSLPALLDTNMVSFIMRNVPSVRIQAAAYLREHDRLTFSAFSYVRATRFYAGCLYAGHRKNGEPLSNFVPKVS